MLGAGPSADAAAAAAFNGRARVMAVNTSFRLVPWADALYACDGAWWDAHPEALTFAGLKITQDAAAAKRHGLHGVELVAQGSAEANTISTGQPGVIGRGGHGGFQGLNLLVQFGVKRILLLGMDFSGEHWHGRHPPGLRNAVQASLTAWGRIFEAQAPRLEALGIEVINLSAQSALSAFRKMSIADVLERA